MPMISTVSLPFPPEKMDGKQRDASIFSSLNGGEEIFVRNLGNKEDDGEIGVFGAEKYFNGGMDDEPPIPVSISARKLQFGKIAEKLDLESMEKPKTQPRTLDDEPPIPVSIPARKLQFVKIAEKLGLESMGKPNIPPRTPSVRSEWSCNSQSALLQSIEKTPTKSERNRGKGFLSRCKCSCCDKSSVDVMEESSNLKAQNPDEMNVKRSSKFDGFKMIESRSWLKEGIGETFTFPISKPELGKFPTKVQVAVQKEEEKKPRKSMEFYGNRPLSFQINTTKVWEGNSQEEVLDSSAINGGLYNDAASDCSSDLFEIESLTGKSSCFHGRQSSDTTSCFTHTTCYAPSEVSIEWSVVTASVADFSATSDYDSDQKPTAAKSGNPILKRRPGILLGCKNEKAVGVAIDAYKKNEKGDSDEPVRRRSDTFLPSTRFEAESKVTGVHSKQRKLALSSLSHPRPLQTQVGNLLEIQ